MSYSRLYNGYNNRSKLELIYPEKLEMPDKLFLDDDYEIHPPILECLRYSGTLFSRNWNTKYYFRKFSNGKQILSGNICHDCMAAVDNLLIKINEEEVERPEEEDDSGPGIEITLTSFEDLINKAKLGKV